MAARGNSRSRIDCLEPQAETDIAKMPAVTVPRWTQNENGERVRVQRQKVVRSWFFERDSGCYIQVKYGSKVLSLSKDGNALFVKQLSEVKGALEAVRSAAISGELDAAIDAAIKPRKGMARS